MSHLPPLRSVASDPLVTVMIVNYNYAHYLPQALDSVLQQTYQKFEIVICDDGSKDNSREIISRYAAREQRIIPIFKENAAVAAALNDTFRASTGDIITMLDADDFFRNTKLERVVERFQKRASVGLVMDALAKVNSVGKTIGKIPQFGSFESGELRESILKTGTFSAAPTSGLSMRRECAEQVFPIPEVQFRTEADAYMRIVAALYYAVDVIDEPLTVYRVHSTNVTASRAVDLKWCERTIHTAERMHAVLKDRAEQGSWQIAPLTDNPSYCEMLLVHDYLDGAHMGQLCKSILQLNRAADRVKTTDRTKVRLKAVLLSAGVLLPCSLRTKLMEMIYLPGHLKGWISRASAIVSFDQQVLSDER